MSLLGKNAFLICFPSSVFTGIFWRFGWTDESLPVLATVCLKIVWILLSVLIYSFRPSIYVDFNLARPRYSSIKLIIGWTSISFSKVASSVL